MHAYQPNRCIKNKKWISYCLFFRTNCIVKTKCVTSISPLKIDIIDNDNDVLIGIINLLIRISRHFVVADNNCSRMIRNSILYSLRYNKNISEDRSVMHVIYFVFRDNYNWNISHSDYSS